MILDTLWIHVALKVHKGIILKRHSKNLNKKQGKRNGQANRGIG